MESHLSPRFKKWMKKSLNDEFSQAIEDNLNGDRDTYDVAQKIINSPEMTELMNAIRTSFVEQIDASRATSRQNSARSARTSAATSRPQTSLSCVSELSAEDWSAKAGGAAGEIGQIVDQIGFDKPDHVRLAGYEALLETELANLPSNSSWDALLKCLRDGLVDGGRSVFEASLLVHARLLHQPQFADPHANLLSAFTELYHSTQTFETLPTLLGGVNFKVFLHEKLFRLMRLILDQHEEVLKGIRTADKLVVDMIEQFVSFLGPQSSVTSAAQIKPLSALQILAVLEPRAGWSRRWMHSLITRKILCVGLSKSPSLLQSVVAGVKRGLEHPPPGLSLAVSDEPADVYVSGESIETLGFLHGLSLLVQLCCTVTGRGLLGECLTEEAFSLPDFLTALLGSLNGLAASAEASNGVYEAVRAALAAPLARPCVLYDARFCQLALSPLVQPEVRMWPHTLDVLAHLLDTLDGPTFLTTEYRLGSASDIYGKRSNLPLVIVLTYACNILRQPIAVMSIEHVVELFKFVGKMFRLHEVFYVVEEVVRDNFYPSVTYMYGKLDKYYVENEYKTQHLDKVVKEMLLSVVSIPLGLQMLSNEPLVFEELIRGSIAPVRASWSAYGVVSFISNSGFLSRGTEILRELAPHVLSTLLVEIGKLLEDPQQFYDPWEHPDVQVFLHVLALFSLNTNCFASFMASGNEDLHIGDDEENNEYITNLHDLIYTFLNIDSPYHHLGLLSLKVTIWNLDIYVYLLNLLDFQQKLLEFQEYGTFLKDQQVEPKNEFIVDESSLLRHAILLSCYYVRHKRSEYLTAEESRLFSKLPPPEGVNDNFIPRTSSESELSGWLQDSGPGLRDNNWVLQTRKAHRASSGPMKNSLLLNLLDQMEQAIPTVEWVEKFKWDEDVECNDDYWLPEEIRGVAVAIHYGEINGQLEKTNESESDLKMFIQSAYKFINYSKPLSYEGFDWFLATVFLICNGDLEKAKTFISQFLHFPSSMFMWPALGRVIDENNERESSTKLLFAHLLEGVISHEFPTIKFALKNECGIDWWMICDRLLTQCFWGILPWSEIVHYFAICILHPPDYVLYYCASLLNHCEDGLIKDITKGKFWPENLILEDFRCHSQIGFMDRLGKRHGGKVLPPLSQRKMNFSENMTSMDEEELEEFEIQDS